MAIFAQSVSRIFKGALKAFRSFPASLGCALLFTVITIVKIQLERQQQEPYDLLLNCLLWALALGAVFSLAAITAAQSRFGTGRAFLAANLLGIIAAAIAFAAMYMFGAADYSGYGGRQITMLAAVRVSAAMLVCLIAFIILTAYPKDRSDFTLSFFMVHKSFFIALIYGAVILGGASGVARAVQSLLYSDMSSKVYMYILALTGFLAYAVFIGYFPDFRRDIYDEHFKTAQKQPRFIEVLFGYIMVPIVLALTLVLLIWAAKTALSGMKVSFVLLSGIAASYTIGGLWLHVMIAGHKTVLAKIYRLVYPAASLVILVFEAWAVVNELTNSGLKLSQYIFILIWIIAAVGAVLLLVMKAKAHSIIAVIACLVVIISVLPSVGYNALPVTAQVKRLEALLESENMLVSGGLRPAASEPARAKRESITDAVIYLAAAQDARLPPWFDKTLANNNIFKTKLGFDQVWPDSDDDAPKEYIGTYLTLAPGFIDISGYDWALSAQEISVKDGGVVTFKGSKGTYRLFWEADGASIPAVKIVSDGTVILEQDLSSYIDIISAKFPLSNEGSIEAASEDMSILFETARLDVLIIFSNVNISLDTANDTKSYWFDINGLYLKENA